ERYKGARAKGKAGGGDMFITVSADGIHWKKWRDAPVFSSSLPNAFDSVNLIFWSEHEGQYVCYFRFMTEGVRSIARTRSRGVLPTGPDEISVYASRNYTYPSAYMERFKLRTDGFVSLHAGHPAGEALTHPLVFRGENLLLNYETSAGGSIRIEVQDAAGRPL